MTNTSVKAELFLLDPSHLEEEVLPPVPGPSGTQGTEESYDDDDPEEKNLRNWTQQTSSSRARIRSTRTWWSARTRRPP
jgi:hypothetical protein